MTAQHYIPHYSDGFQGNKSLVCINVSMDDLKDPFNPLNGSSSSVVGSITTPF